MLCGGCSVWNLLGAPRPLGGLPVRGGIPASAGMTGWINDGGSGHGKEAAACVACPCG